MTTTNTPTETLDQELQRLTVIRSAADAIITFQGVSKHYAVRHESAVTAVDDVSLSVAQGAFMVITGRSGSGKTTLLNLAAGLTRPTAGQVRIAGHDPWSLPDPQQSVLRSQQIGFIFQFPSLLPALTVLENVALPTTFGPVAGRADAFARAAELIETVGLTSKQRAYPRQLSAGQQQRVVIARALINRPQILLADEPTSNLDEQTEGEIMDLFKEIHSRTGITIMLVTHTSQLVGYGTQALHMIGGRLASSDRRFPRKVLSS